MFKALVAFKDEQVLSIYVHQNQILHIALLDMNMRAWEGIGASRNCCQSTPQTRAVMASGRNRDILFSGARGSAGKPFQSKELAAVLQEVLDKKQR
ncbi:MAG TPA: hypothetical protein ENN39_04260 [Desulfonatronum sp.]|nr:hypothetical protein [Desulfonatronum sp.]